MLTLPMSTTKLSEAHQTEEYLGNLGSDIGLAVLPEKGVVSAKLRQLKHHLSACPGSQAYRHTMLPHW